MFILDKGNNKINKINMQKFHDLGYKEREHLQEWIAGCPECLCMGDGERLLIIQKEFAGFDDTNERLDLLAIDQNGILVIIENKLDDTGKDVVWQALKYASYCSTLKQNQIRDIYQNFLDKSSLGESAEENIIEFFGGKPFEEIRLNPDNKLRIILVAAKFRKEVTSTAMWLLNYGIRIQCIKVEPYELEGKVLLDIEQIIPVKEAEDYLIKIADKNREQSEKEESTGKIEDLRKRFWANLLERYRKIEPSFQNVTASTDHWINCGAGVSGCSFNFVITKHYCAVDLSIAKEKTSSEKIYDRLYQHREEIETKFGEKLKWERLDEKKSCRISYRNDEVDITQEEDWNEITAFLCEHMPRLIEALREPLKKVAHK